MKETAYFSSLFLMSLIITTQDVREAEKEMKAGEAAAFDGFKLEWLTKGDMTVLE